MQPQEQPPIETQQTILQETPNNTSPQPMEQPYSEPPAPSKSSKKVLKGILWIFSGWILLFLAVMFQILKFILPDGIEALSLIFNIVTWLIGVAAVILIIIGPIIGIIILAKKNQ